MKKKNHAILLIDENKASDKIQHLFLIETISKVGIERKFSHMLKSIHEKLTANTILHGKRLNQEEITYMCSNHFY